jgi:hypothetical protein
LAWYTTDFAERRQHMQWALQDVHVVVSDINARSTEAVPARAQHASSSYVSGPCARTYHTLQPPWLLPSWSCSWGTPGTYPHFRHGHRSQERRCCMSFHHHCCQYLADTLRIARQKKGQVPQIAVPVLREQHGLRLSEAMPLPIQCHSGYAITNPMPLLCHTNHSVIGNGIVVHI